MSLNTAHANGGVLIFNGEVILLYCDGVEMHVDGSDAKDFGGSKKGRMYLTSHRMIFVNKSEKDRLQSFSFPFFSLSAIELEQPIFGANFIKGKVTAQVGGNWTGKADFKVKFNTGGAIEFGQAMLQAAKMASKYMPPQPPPYIPSQGPYYPAQPPAYMPPAGGMYGFVPPTHVFPNAPPADSVYTTDMPPPYPGIYPPPYAAGNQGNYPPANQGNYPPANVPYSGAPQTGYATGPPPPGFANVPNGGAPPQYQPPQNPQGFADYNAYAATNVAYKDPYNPDAVYAPGGNFNSAPGYPEPPPPYYDHKKSQ